MKTLIGLAALSLVVSVAACAAPAAGTGEPTTAAGSSTSALTLTEETDTKLAGNYVHGDSVITFEEQLASPMLHTKLVVNGAEYDYDRDLVKSTLVIDGHGNTLLAADSAALAGLEHELDKLGQPTQMREALFKTISLMAAAPRGTTLMQKTITPKVAAAETDRSYCVSDEGITYMCSCNGIPSGCSANFVGWSGNNPIYQSSGNSGAFGTAYGCSGVPQINHEHELCEYTAEYYHGRYTGYSYCGWGASACEGRCGAGCPNSYNFYYTKDCFDHDLCLDNHPSASATSTFGDCGNEFDQASGDFSYGTSDGYASSCGGYAPGDTTR